MPQLRFESALLTMPAELRVFTLQNCIAASPYNRCDSGSFYSTSTKTWDFTEHGTIRVSDHWNFYSRGDKHCITDIDDKKIAGKWVVAKYDAFTGIYNVICADDKDLSAWNKRAERRNNKPVEISASILRQKRLDLLAAKREQRRREARAKKIKAGNLWIEVNVNQWSGTGRRVRFAGTETIIGKLIWESKSGSSFVIETPSGNRREIRKTNSYRELPRKPYTKKATAK